MSRILLNLTDGQMSALQTLVEQERKPRTAIIRNAIDAYLNQRKSAANVKVFGLWKDRKNVDGLQYQRALRAEW